MLSIVALALTFVTQSVFLLSFGAIQMIHNAVGGGRVSYFLEKSVTKMYGSTLFALRAGLEIRGSNGSKCYHVFSFATGVTV